MAMIGKALRLHRRQNKTVREIAPLASLSRNTVRKYLRAKRVVEPRCRRASRPIQPVPCRDVLEMALPTVRAEPLALQAKMAKHDTG